MQFIKVHNEVFAFHEQQAFDLASYMVDNPHYLQMTKDRALITCKQTFSTRTLFIESNGVCTLDLRQTLDTRALWAIAKHIKGV